MRWLLLAIVTFFCLELMLRWEELWDLLPLDALHDHLAAMGAGGVIYLLLRRRAVFWETLVHELTHMLFALLTLNRVKGLAADDSGSGKLVYQGGTNWLISLSPYFFPLPVFLLLLIGLLTADTLQWGLELVTAGFYGWQLLSSLGQVSLRQSDITKSGILFSFLAILAFTGLIALGLLFYWGGEGTELVAVFREVAADWGLVERRFSFPW